MLRLCLQPCNVACTSPGFAATYDKKSCTFWNTHPIQSTSYAKGCVPAETTKCTVPRRSVTCKLTLQ